MYQAGDCARIAHPPRAEPPLWTVEPDWSGETAFIVGGGPSVLSAEIDRLRGRRVLVINASYQIAPFAELMFFNDSGFWNRHRERAGKEFSGQIVTTEKACRSPGLVRLNRRKPTGLSDDRNSAGVEWTSFTGALDIVALKGVDRIVTLGLDCGPDSNGRTHHHAPHPETTIFAWDRQRRDLENYVAPLKARGIQVINASPGSSIPFWPIRELRECL